MTIDTETDISCHRAGHWLALFVAGANAYNGRMGNLVLRRIAWDDGQPSLDPEDYSVREGDRNVGRIYHTTGGARGSGLCLGLAAVNFG
jgi:hypothetical protein